MSQNITANAYTFDCLLVGEHFICVDDLTNEGGAQEYKVASQKQAEIFRHGILGGCSEYVDFSPGKLVLRIRP